MIIRKYKTAGSVTFLENKLRNASRDRDSPVSFCLTRENGTISVYRIDEAMIEIPNSLRVQSPPWLIEIRSESEDVQENAIAILKKLNYEFKFEAVE